VDFLPSLLLSPSTPQSLLFTFDVAVVLAVVVALVVVVAVAVDSTSLR
jgi:hypothetical protein